MPHWLENDRFPLCLAPMAGRTDPVFRQLCKERGADVMVSEFVLAGKLIHGTEAVWELVDFSPEQRPMGVQIFGASAREMAEAARRIEARLRPDFIDLNFGCPAPKVTACNGGSGLLQDLPAMGNIAETVAKATPETVVTAKMRIGWDANSIVACQAAKTLEQSGMRAVAIHGRTREQGYSGKADWGAIAEAAEAVAIPVIGNGDIASADDILRIRKETCVKGAMIGRAALRKPWIFNEIKTALKTGKAPPPPDAAERWEILIAYAESLLARPTRDKLNGRINWMRSRLSSLTKEMPGGRRLRERLAAVETLDDLRQLAADAAPED